VQTETFKPWCLVLVLWGDKYRAVHINAIVTNAFLHSASCSEAILMTDCHRENLDERVRQVVISDDLNRPECKSNYTIKLSLFDSRVLPPHRPCVYLDLDTVVIGDLGRIAALIRDPNDLFMLPPGGLQGFGALRRWLFWLTGGRHMATGNSSIVAFHSGMDPNLTLEFLRLRSASVALPKVLGNDDLFISWFGQRRLKAIPPHLGVMFRREFLTRFRPLGWLLSRLPWVRRRRDAMVAVTFNGVEHKLENLLQLPDGALHRDSKGRFGYWSNKEMGSIREKILKAAANLLPHDGVMGKSS
jgi:hypothetical protein